MGKIGEKQVVKIADLKPYERNARTHSAEQVDQIAKSIEEFGFISPVLIDEDGNVIAGHGRIMAAQKLGLTEVPCLYIEGLTEDQRKAYVLADNRLTELGGWDMETVEEELKALADVGFEVSVTGFNWDEAADVKIDMDESAELNPVAVLPESRVLVSSISAFGTNSERFIEIQLSPEDAEHVLKRAEELPVSEIAEKLRGALRGL